MLTVEEAEHEVVDDVVQEVGYAPKLRAFVLFHRHNRHVCAQLEAAVLADLTHRAGRFSVYAAYSSGLRWYSAIETVAVDPHKLSNNHQPYYARLFLHRYPEYAERILTKALKRVPGIASGQFATMWTVGEGEDGLPPTVPPVPGCPL